MVGDPPGVRRQSPSPRSVGGSVKRQRFYLVQQQIMIPYHTICFFITTTYTALEILFSLHHQRQQQIILKLMIRKFDNLQYGFTDKDIQHRQRQNKNKNKK